MKWPSRRHRGSQVGNLSPVVSVSPPGTLTARQSLTASLSRDQDLANEPDRLFSLVDDILLDLETNRLSIVASTEVEDAPEVLGRARQDRPPGW